MARKLVLIDGSNLWAAAQSAGYKINFQRLKKHLGEDSKYVYFTALPPGNEQSPIRPLIDWLKHHQFHMVLKEMKSYDNEGVIKNKGNCDIEIAVTAIQLSNHYKHISLFSGDGDFCCLINHLQLHAGCIVDVYSSKDMASNDIRGQADNFHYLESLHDELAWRQGDDANTPEVTAGRKFSFKRS